MQIQQYLELNTLLICSSWFARAQTNTKSQSENGANQEGQLPQTKSLLDLATFENFVMQLEKRASWQSVSKFVVNTL